MTEEKIEIKLPNGDSLVAEKCPHEGGQIAVGIVHDGVWIQDLAVVETAKTNNTYGIYVYADEYSEGYTDKYYVKRVPDSAL